MAQCMPRRRAARESWYWMPRETWHTRPGMSCAVAEVAVRLCGRSNANTFQSAAVISYTCGIEQAHSTVSLPLATSPTAS